MVDHLPPDFIIHADEAILVVNKPYGLLSLQDGYDRSLPHLVTVLEPVYGRLWMVHRLDRDTSGVLVVARTAEAHKKLNLQFQARQVSKLYLALALGSPPWEEKDITVPLRKDGDRKHRTVVDFERGKPASTAFRVVERYDGCSLIEARPSTGYTHQIRAHLAFLGFPLAVDPLYGDGAPVEKDGVTLLGRLGLHASMLSFLHPLTAAQVSYSAPLPADFAGALAALRGQREEG